MQLVIGLGQMDVALGEPEANLERVRALASEAAAAGADLLVLPELWGSSYDLEHAARYATPLGEGLFAETAALARKRRLHIVGSLLETDQGRVYNTAVLYGPAGEPLGMYRKVHLFGLMKEPQYLAAGERVTVCQTEWGPTGLAICYDLRFPELFRALALAGARVVLMPAQWPQPRIPHWSLLVRARAVENQIFVAACNRVGVERDTAFPGRSAVVGPRGEVLVEGDDRAGLLLVEVDLAEVDVARRYIPVFADRRPAAYRAGEE